MTIYAESVPYWKTSQSSPDTWIERTKREIQSIKGTIESEVFGSDVAGRAAFMLVFVLGTERYKLMWPVLPSKEGNTKAAKVQAATALYHDVKARVVSAKFLGVRSAFFGYMMLPNGKTATETTNAEFLEIVPPVILLGSGK